MSIYEESILRLDVKYKVREVSKFPKSKQYMIGQHCVLKQVIGSTAHIMFTGRMTDIPIRSLIHVPEYTAKSVRSENADGFVIVTQNPLNLPVGLAFLNPDKTLLTSTHFTVSFKGKTISVPLEYVCALVKNTKLVKTPKKEKLNKELGFSTPLIEACGELLSATANREPITEIPPELHKLLPGINLVELRDMLLSEEDVFTDYLGNVHSTIAEVDKANVKIFHKILTERLITKAVTSLRISAEKIRNEN